MKIEGAMLFTRQKVVKFHLLHLQENPQNHPTEHDGLQKSLSNMSKKDILKVVSKSDEKLRSCVVYEPKVRKIPRFTPPRTAQNHPTVTIYDDYLRWVIKIF